MRRFDSIIVLPLLAFYLYNFVYFSKIKGVNGQEILTQQCLGCICEATSGCNGTSLCSGDVCGPFKITWAYWADSGKPTLNNEKPESNTAYSNCANDIVCAALTVQGYMKKFQQDCNNDGRIDCDDFVVIHRFGGYGCKGSTLSGEYGQRYEQCKRLIS